MSLSPTTPASADPTGLAHLDLGRVAMACLLIEQAVLNGVEPSTWDLHEAQDRLAALVGLPVQADQFGTMLFDAQNLLRHLAAACPALWQ